MSSVVIFSCKTKDGAKSVVAEWNKTAPHSVSTYSGETLDRRLFYPNAEKAIAAAKRKLAKLNRESL